jgi:hypothetical protein
VQTTSLQTPDWQLSFVPLAVVQALPHPPQLFVSVSMSTSHPFEAL